MEDSYVASLTALLPPSTIQSLATHLGTSEETVFDGVQSSIAAVVTGLAQRSHDQGLLDKALQMATSTPENSMMQVASNGSLSNDAASVLAQSTQLVSAIFEGKLGSVTQALSRQTGLGGPGASTLLALGSQTILGLLGMKLRDGSVNAATLPRFLSKESEALKAMLPAGFMAAVAPSTVPAMPGTATHTHKIDVNPVLAQAVETEKKQSILPWLLGLLLALLVIGFWWFRSQQAPVANAPTMSASVPATNVTSATGANLGALVDATLPDSTVLSIPEHGVEGKLLAFIKDASRTPDKTTWFDFDRLLFKTGSASLQPQSTEQLTNIASILKAYPAVHLTIGGYTDNTGNAGQNLKLSQDRADSVAEQLETMGISRDRLVAKGYGDAHPVADNSTENGRALNRRISMLVTAK